MKYPEYDDLKTVFPRDAGNLRPFLAALSTYGADVLNTPSRVTEFITQCGVESDYFHTYKEYASGAAYEGRKDLGNTEPGDGRRYPGGGPIQLTGRGNYRAATPFVRELLGRPDIDLEETPELVWTDRAVGFATSLWYWQEHNLNKWADRDDTVACSRGVNRGNPESNKKANGEDARVALSKRIRPIIFNIQGDLPKGANPTLWRGNKGKAVENLQQLLNQNGAILAVDGDFGAGTEEAVRDFQTAHGLTADGIVGRKTWQALGEPV